MMDVDEEGEGQGQVEEASSPTGSKRQRTGGAEEEKKNG